MMFYKLTCKQDKKTVWTLKPSHMELATCSKSGVNSDFNGGLRISFPPPSGYSIVYGFTGTIFNLINCSQVCSCSISS